MIDDGDMVVTTVDDALIRGDQMLVLVGSEVMLLSPVSSEIVRISAGGLSIADVGTHLVHAFGPPPEGTTVDGQVRVLVEALCQVGIVRITSGDM